MVVGELLSSILGYFSVGTVTGSGLKSSHDTQEKRDKQQTSPFTYNNGLENENILEQKRVMKDNFVGEKKSKESWRLFAQNSNPKPEKGETNEIMKKMKRSMSASSEGKLMSLIGVRGSSDITKVETLSRPTSAFSALSTRSQPFQHSPVYGYASSHPNRVETSQMDLPDQVYQEAQTFQTNGKVTHLHSVSPNQSKDGVATSITVTSIQTEPPERSSHSENELPTMERERFQSPTVYPMYQYQRVAPTPMSTRSPTPMLEEGEKKVRFLDSGVVGEIGSRPSSGTSEYTNVIKNSSRYSYAPNEPDAMYSVIGHSPKICNCPCHFFSKYNRSVGVQVSGKETESRKPLVLLPYHPKHYRLFILPSLEGLSAMSWPSKLINFIVRVLLSQIGLAVVVIVWWLIGALVFSTIEGPIQRGHVKRMEVIRSDLAIDLATELRQVKPYDAIWKRKIEQYMLKLENAVLRAVKSGYTSSKVSWGIADSFLYSVSLTTLLGPGGLVIQSSLTKMFSLVYAFVGIPIIFLLLFNMAQTVREGLTFLWARLRKQRQVSDIDLVTPSPSSGSTMEQSVEEGSSRQVSAIPRRERTPMSHPPRVSLLENSLPGSRPGSALIPLGQQVGNRPDNSVSTKPRSSLDTSNDPSSSSSLPREVPTSLPFQHQTSFLINRNIFRQTLDKEHFLRKKNTLPWIIVTLLPTFYFVFGTILLIVTQKLSVVSALFVIVCNFLSLDHSGIAGSRTLLTSEPTSFLYAILVLIGVFSTLIFTLGMWPKVTTSLEEAGRNLSVVKQIELYR